MDLCSSSKFPHIIFPSNACRCCCWHSFEKPHVRKNVTYHWFYWRARYIALNTLPSLFLFFTHEENNSFIIQKPYDIFFVSCSKILWICHYFECGLCEIWKEKAPIRSLCLFGFKLDISGRSFP